MVQPESRIATRIMKMVRKRGGFCFKVWGNDHMMAGLPDVLCCYRGQFIGFEVKTPTGVVSDVQRYVMGNIMTAQGIVTVPRNVSDASDVLDWVDAWMDNPKIHTDDLNALFDEESVWRA